jgi:hypothetical protein
MFLGFLIHSLSLPSTGAIKNGHISSNTWVELEHRDGTIDALYGHWILGKQAGKPQSRWSIMRNLLHWVD